MLPITRTATIGSVVRTRLALARNFTTTSTLKKIIPEATQTTPGKRPDEMEGHASKTAVNSGAKSATGTVKASSGVHEDERTSGVCVVHICGSVDHILTDFQAPTGGESTTTGTPAFNKDGAIGSMFKG